LKAEGETSLAMAAGENPNPLYQVPAAKPPIVSSKAALAPVTVRETYLYDLPTEAGKEYTVLLSR
jgi:alpha-L-fucosidase 2